MPATIVWNISQLDCLPQSPEGMDYVVTAHWQCYGSEESGGVTYGANNYGTCSFTVVQGETFTPYADLTLDQVLGWCWNNGVDKAATEASVQQQIDNQINPPIVSPPLPWAPPAPVV
jgi:hypothetical protein